MSKAIRKTIESEEVKEEIEFPKVGRDTDITTVYPTIIAAGGATFTDGYIVLNAVNESAAVQWIASDFIDTERDLRITFLFQRTDGNADTVDYTLDIDEYPLNAAGAGVINQAIVLPASAANEFEKYEYTFEAANINADTVYNIRFIHNEAARAINCISIILIYYMKRTL